MAEQKKKTTSRPATPRVTSVSDFKKKRQNTVTLPSGAVVVLRNPGGLRVFMRNGTIPNALMPLVQESLDSGKSFDNEKAQDKVDEETITQMMEMMDTVAMSCFKEPQLHPIPEEGVERDDNLLYVDDVDDEDKMFIFQWLSGGTTDVARFREEQASRMAAVAGQPEVGSKAE